MAMKKGTWWKNYSKEEIEIRMAYIAGCRWRQTPKAMRSKIAKKGWLTRRKNLSTVKPLQIKK